MPILHRRKLFWQPKSVHDSAVAPGGYTGPGDIVSYNYWWGLRGYSTAFSTGSNPAIDVVDSATGLTTTTVNILANGHLDTATIAGLGYAVKVKKLYDQTGNGLHLTQSTLASMPALNLTGIGSLPTMTFNGSSQTLTNESATLASADPSTISLVTNSTNTGSQQSGFLIIGSNAQQLGLRNSADNQAFLYSGVVLSATATDGSWHALHGVINDAVSDMNVDGTVHTGDSGGSTGSGCNIFLGSTGSGQWFLGSVVEGGYRKAANNGTESTNLSTNSASFWGY